MWSIMLHKTCNICKHLKDHAAAQIDKKREVT